MEILVTIPKTPSKLVPPVLILPDYRTQLPCPNPREPSKNDPPFITLSPHLFPYLHIYYLI
jgi:hypothetical protein